MKNAALTKGVAMALAKVDIDKISERYHYKDEKPNGEQDSKLVACGQCQKNGNSYSELEYIFEHDLYPLIQAGLIKQEQAIRALDKACKELPVRKERTEFHQFLADTLGQAVGKATPKSK